MTTRKSSTSDQQPFPSTSRPHILPPLALVCDLDGTLLDTEPLYNDAMNIVTQEYGHIYGPDLQKQTMGRSELLGAKIIVEALHLPLTPQQFIDKRDKHLLKLFETVKPMPGVIKVMKHLKKFVTYR